MKIDLPLSIVIPRKTKADKVFHLNLNIYRNSHYMTLNQAKTLWKDVVIRAVEGISPLNDPPYIFWYTVYPPSGRAFDLGNVLPIVQKFTDDELIELGLISNDNYKVIRHNFHSFGEIDKENGRVELEIYRLTAEFEHTIEMLKQLQSDYGVL